MPFERTADCSTNLDIPDSNGAVIGSGDDVLPVRRVSNRPYPVGMPLEGIADGSTSLGIPDSNCAVGGSGDDVLSIRRIANG